MAVKVSPEILDNIKDRVSLYDVVSKTVSLKRKGSDWWGCCPFHNEKSSSFHIKENQGQWFYHCFGCGAHGDAVTFVKETRGGDFIESVEYLADLAGVKLEEYQYDPAQQKIKEDGLQALAQSANFFYKQRKQNVVASEYLSGRKLSDATLKEFAIGYAPSGWTSLTEALRKQGFSEKVLRESGMSLQSNSGKNDYDRFRDRIMFPIQDTKGKVVAFGGRIIGDGEPKYLNSPETPFFNKRFVLYNLNRAIEHIRKEKQALIVEGYMDVVGLWQSGIKTAVAPLGTAITESQVKLLWRYFDSPIVCMDGDEAGRKAAIRIAKKILPELVPGKTLRFVLIPAGEDPDSFVQKNGKEAFNKLLKETLSIEEILWQEVVTGKDLSTGDGRAQADSEIKRLVEDIKDSTVKFSYQKVLRDRMWKHGRKQWKNKFGGKENYQLDGKLDTRTEEQARILLAILFRKPEILAEVYEKLSVINFVKNEHKEFKDIIFRFFMNGELEKGKLDTYFNNAGLLDSMQKEFYSELLVTKQDEELLGLWLELFMSLTTKRLGVKRKSLKGMVENMFDDGSASNWDEFKQIHNEK